MLNKDENLAKAKDFMERSEKLYKNGLSQSKTPDTRTDMMRESTELMKNAANHFGLAKDWRNAANAFLKAAEMEKLRNYPSAHTYGEAATMQIKYDKLAAVKTLELKAEASCAKRQIHSAAETKEQIGKIYEGEKEFLLAVNSYNEAFELYETTDLITPLWRFDLLLKVAELKVGAEVNKQHIAEALKIYESVISKYVEAKESSEQIYKRVIMLHLANNDIDKTNKSIQECADLSSIWKKSQEFNSLESLVKAFEEKDVRKVSGEFCAFWEKQWKKPSEVWSTAVLNRIKAHLGEVTKGEFYV